MAVPSLITDLSSTIASNSPGGSDLISGNLDNYLRAAFGILRQQSLNEDWVPYGEAVTYVSATSFTVVDATAGSSRWYMGRPFKATVTAGTAYGVIASTSLSGGTRTVNVISDVALDAGLSRVDLGVELRSAQPDPKNYLINPMFRFWQRNTSFTLAASAIPTKTADGWNANCGSVTGVATVSRQAHTLGQTSVPYEPLYFLRWDQTVGSTGTAPYLRQHIEGVRSLAGRTVTVTILAKLQSAGTLTGITPSVVQNFGTGGGPSANVVTSGSDFLPTSGYKLYSTTIAVPSVTGKTVGTTADTDSTYIDFAAVPATATFTVDIAGVWVNAGSEAILAPPLPFEDGYRQVQRRYYKTFTVDQVPAQNIGDANTAAQYTVLRAGANACHLLHPLPANLRSEVNANQSITFYSPNAAASTWYNVTGAAASGGAAKGTNTIARNFVMIRNNQAAGDGLGDLVAVHFALDCEYAT